MKRVVLASVCLVIGAFAGVCAQTTEKKYSDPPVSMGQPDRYRIGVGVSTGYGFGEKSGIWRLFGNFTPEGYFPNLGIDLASFELGFGQYDRDSADFGAEIGYFVRIPYLRGGVEYSLTDNDFNGIVTIQYAVRRGGLFGGGEEIRLDYRMGDDNQFLAGITFNQPFRKYRATRPKYKYIRIPQGNVPEPTPAFGEGGGLSPDLEHSLKRIEHSVEMLDKMLTPRLFVSRAQDVAEEYREHIRIPGHTFEEEDATYHRELRNAFTNVVGGDEVVGEQLASSAESIIFQKIVVPYNRHFGQHKQPKAPTAFVEEAVVVFDQMLNEHSRFKLLSSQESAVQKATAGEVFRRTVVAIDDAGRAANKRWRTSLGVWLQKGRFVWLPLNYGLRPDDYDTQEEWDAVLAALTTHDFTDCNTMKYLPNEQFHYELKNMLHETNTYHVLIIHDFQGKDNHNNTDPKGWDMVANGYMDAFTQAVKAIDRGEREKLPQFMLFIDQNFYQGNNSREIITYLEKLYAPDELKLKDKNIQTMVEEMHRKMRDAIRSSPAFSAMADEMLAKLFKVNVNVTNPWDPAFAFDISMRDHRKFTFRDVFEEDPSSGAGILTGTGIGKHYHPPGWEDRAMEIRGPVLVDLKRAARDLCISQGFEDREIPYYLQDRPYPDNYAELCERLRTDRGWRANVMIAFNATGFGYKQASVMRAAIYNLAPRGSVLIAIDSLWLSDFWAEMFVCAGLRGVHAYAIAPSPENAPSAADPTMYLMRENLEVMIDANDFFAEDMAKTGGAIHVGLYKHDRGIGDAVSRGQAILDVEDKLPFFVTDFPIGDAVTKEVSRYLKRISEEPAREITVNVSDDMDVKPYLHMKTQFFATPVGMQVLTVDGWGKIAERYIAIRDKQARGEPTGGLTPANLVGNDTSVGAGYEKYLQSLPPHERDSDIFTFTIGSMNQDRRGMVSDGEVLAAFTGYSALIGVLDMIYMVGTATFAEDIDDFEELFPDPGMRSFMRKTTRYMQDMF
ncbi:MAG: hypothetical protein O7D32_01995 [bacterium]|nr:hypothetical protein [bacterium]